MFFKILIFTIFASFENAFYEKSSKHISAEEEAH